LVLGFCTGLLPAAAAVVSTDLLHLIEISVEVVQIALRAALYAHHRSAMIESGMGNWAVLVSDISPSEISIAIDQFNSEWVSLQLYSLSTS
jgi:hypothetical protein